MNIKTRLTIQFGSISIGILALALLSIYFLSENYRQNEYYERLISRSVNLAKLLIEVDEIDEFLLYRIEKDNPVKLPEEAIKIYNFKDEIIFNTDDENLLPSGIELLNEIRLDSLVTFRQSDREFLGLLFTSKYDRFVITVSAIDIYGNRKMKNLRNVLLAVFILGGFITLLTARFFAFQAMRPVQNLIDQVEEFSPSDLSKRLAEANGSDEIAQIAQSFNAMMGRVENAFRTQKNFIANASHEMRTPLTAITGQLEVLALKDRNTEEYKETVASVIEDMHKLNKLANRLLLLAQTETDAISSDFNNCRIDEIVWTCIADLKKQNPKYEATVYFNESINEEHNLVVFGSELLLKTVIINLLENGCKYSDDHKVTLDLSATEQKLHMTFTDQGIGIPLNDLKNIFSPFFRGSNVAQRQGHGIGLSLVYRIVNLYGGSISIDSTPDISTTVRATFPLAPSF